MSIDERFDMEFAIFFQRNKYNLDNCDPFQISNSIELTHKVNLLENKIQSLTDIINFKSEIKQTKWKRNIAIILLLNLWDELFSIMGMIAYIMLVR